MRLPSHLVIATLMLAALPGLLHAQSSGFASVGQPTAGASGTSLESRAMPAATQSPVAAPETTDHGPMASATPTDASMSTDLGAPPDVGPVPLPAPEELLTTASVGADASTGVSAASNGPSLAAATDGMRSHVARDDLSSSASAHQGGIGMPGVLMIVGAAAILIGLLIGGGAGTAIAVAGAVAGLYGLYLYLK